MRDTIGIGLIGCGTVAGLRHMPALTGLPGARVVALADPHSGSVERLGDRYEVRQRYADHEALLQDPAVDVVAVLVPAARHAEILRVDPKSETEQVDRLKAFKADRDQDAVQKLLEELREACRGTDNLLPPIRQALEDRASMGEVCGAMRDVFGEYQGGAFF